MDKEEFETQIANLERYMSYGTTESIDKPNPSFDPHTRNSIYRRAQSRPLICLDRRCISEKR